MNEKLTFGQSQPQRDIKTKKQQGHKEQSKKQKEDEAIQAFIGHVEKNDDNPGEC